LEEGGKRGDELLEVLEVGEGDQCPTEGSVIEFGAFCTAIMGP